MLAQKSGRKAAQTKKILKKKCSHDVCLKMISALWLSFEACMLGCPDPPPPKRTPCGPVWGSYHGSHPGGGGLPANLSPPPPLSSLCSPLHLCSTQRPSAQPFPTQYNPLHPSIIFNIPPWPPSSFYNHH